MRKRITFRLLLLCSVIATSLSQGVPNCKQGNVPAVGEATCIECEDGYYFDTSTHCGKCSPPCKTCRYASTFCTSCEPRTFLLSGSYTTPSPCSPCNIGCEYCKDTLMCEVCQKGYYLDESTKICTRCGYGCELCSSSKHCVACLPGYKSRPESNGHQFCIPDDQGFILILVLVGLLIIVLCFLWMYFCFVYNNIVYEDDIQKTIEIRLGRSHMTEDSFN